MALINMTVYWNAHRTVYGTYACAERTEYCNKSYFQIYFNNKPRELQRRLL